MDRPTLGTAQVIRANSRNLPLADNSVDLVVTSPPYFALRSYQDGGRHYGGQIGAEQTLDEYVDSLLDVTRECVRVLKPFGSLWVNLGDKYVADNRGSGVDTKRMDAKWAPRGDLGYVGREVAARKSLMGIPWRYALRCIDDLSLILRAEVIWSKPNGLPESVTDRVRRSHEQWFHFTLEPRYFSAVDEIREPHVREWGGTPNGGRTYEAMKAPGTKDANLPNALPNPLGKLPGSVWTVPTEPLRVPDHLGVDHFAAFPTEWPKRIIAGWSPAGVCVECGEGRRPVVVKGKVDAYTTNQKRTGRHDLHDDGARGVFGKAGQREFYRETATITGYACDCGQFGPNDCACCGEVATNTVRHSGASVPVCLRHYNHWRTPTTPAVVLDPFGGTGTTAMVAKALGRHGISVDMSADYCRLAEWRTNDRDQLAKVLGVAKAEQPHEDEQSLFDLMDGEAS